MHGGLTLKIATQTVTITKEGDERNRKNTCSQVSSGPAVFDNIIMVEARRRCTLASNRKYPLNWDSGIAVCRTRNEG